MLTQFIFYDYSGLMFRIFEKLGGQDAALDAIKPSGSERWPVPSTLSLWRANGTLPGTVVLALMQVCDQRGIPYTHSDFIAEEPRR